MAGVDYRYQLRHADEVVATGHLNRDGPLEVGEWIEVAGHQGTVRAIEPQLHEDEMRLVVQLLQHHS